MANELTQAEKTFLNRMVPHVMAGKSFEDAARAVLEDDERIWLASTMDTDQGKAIRSELASEVYQRIRKAA